MGRPVPGGMRVASWPAVAAMAIGLVTPAIVEGSVSRLCDVSYLTPQGWTTPERREVVFQSGRELNQTSTNYFSYSPYGKFASVSYDAGEIAVIEITAALVPDSTGFSNENFRSLFSVRAEIEAEQINAPEKGRKWRIIAKQGVPPRFIDPRVEGAAEELGLSGYVLAPDDTPVSGGTVVLQWLSRSVTAQIDRSGRFHLVPAMGGVQELHVIVRGLAPYRVRVTVPASRTLRLPAIRLAPATYFQVRFVSAAGEPLASPRIRRRSLDGDGMPVLPQQEDGVETAIETDGVVVVGPLPRGVTTVAVDTAGFARTRLPDLHVTGADTLLDGGTVVVERGAVLDVDVVGGTGAPLAGHEVFLEDARPLSPLSFARAQTDPQGRARFDRLAAGQYLVSTRAAARCGVQTLVTTRRVSVSGNGTLRTRLIAGGTATFRVMSPFAPMSGAAVRASPDSGTSSSRATGGRAGAALRGPGLMPRTSGAFCGGSTDGEGRVVLSTFPPGPARVHVRLPNSTYVRRVNVPVGGQETPLLVPDGWLPLRVIDALTNKPVAGAAITWSGAGARIEATTVASGDALLEGIGATQGTLVVTANGYQRAEGTLAEPPAIAFEIALTPTPPAHLQARVITTAGEPVGHAIVELAADDPMAIGQIAAANADGVVTFVDAPPGTLNLTASAEGFAAVTSRITADDRDGVVLTLPRPR